MIKSMTGYGRGQATVDGTDILVEIKSVNNRYYDFSARLPRMYGYLEEKLKTFMNGSISRGKIEVSVSIYNSGSKSEEISINLDVANGYINALREANQSLGLTDDITLSHVSRFPEVFIVKKIIEDEESVWNNIKPVAEEAVAKFVAMRETEGEKMKEDLSSRLDFILSKVEEVEKISPTTTENYRNRLYQKLKDVLSDNNIDEQRILTEAAIFSEKVAVDEETVRLRSHISQFRELLETDEPVGRKLDFLVQEMNRESNTIGSKAQDIAITKIVVDVKSEIEKIREQIQNIE
ncbi:MAG: YicC family protein [Oscillospiraceae bacterium]|nr:YicC family protein [Oscillospiraceae bacterium]MBR6695171.1 YicC family protein [Oscillospiraceae bacterium]